MRLWSIHPSYLDPKGLVALWREALLAQKVLQGNTRGYKNHPQLTRFRNTPDPLGAISSYLMGVADEADIRAYKFDRGKIAGRRLSGKMPVTKGQLEYEFAHLMVKLRKRAPERHIRLKETKGIECHPIFHPTPGHREDWEIV